VTVCKGLSGVGFNIIGSEDNEGIFVFFVLAGCTRCLQLHTEQFPSSIICYWLNGSDA